MLTFSSIHFPRIYRGYKMLRNTPNILKKLFRDGLRLCSNFPHVKVFLDGTYKAEKKNCLLHLFTLILPKPMEFSLIVSLRINTQYFQNYTKLSDKTIRALYSR